ncbi:hypothetical protein J2Z22_000772 [Paenibacillus forsythiae]|uniref:Magnesium transporter MgtE intracellular domain-containing protein n=1 Tax=Paenibacillus forsythiae TaxID=365616 RepID=A0ABU3H3G4_9BACL|nr:hypothetical protein [Paenibacillus forsythiae]MDT3425256.1 hypothetical protein [Paenibacillus forsythiae]
MKFVKQVLGICLIVVLASSLSILTTGVIVNAYVQSVMSEFGLKVDTPAPGFGGMLSSLMGTSGKAPPSKGTAKDDGGSAGAGSPEVKEPSGTGDNGGTVPAATADTGGSTESEKAPDNALPVMGAASTEEQSESAQDQQLVMTPEAMKDLKDSLPSEEKVSVFNILMNKVPQEEMQKISAAMENGLTEQEVTEVQSIISKYVSQEEYDKLMKILTSGTGGQ